MNNFDFKKLTELNLKLVMRIQKVEKMYKEIQMRNKAAEQLLLEAHIANETALYLKNRAGWLDGLGVDGETKEAPF
jgi:hypothetical protein